MKVILKTIPHNEQRYETSGDWWIDKKGTLQIRVSDCGNEDYENLIATHEYVEAQLCKKRGITAKQIDEWDKQYEKARAKYPQIFGETEPGEHAKAPYANEHLFASRLEHSLAMEYGVNWEEYDKRVNEL